MFDSDRRVGDTLVAAGYPVIVESTSTHDSPDPPAGDEGGRLTLDGARDARHVADMVARYTKWLAVPQPAAGGACATQHYAGRIAGYAVGTWALTGVVVDFTDPCLHVMGDGHGRTQHILVPPDPQGATGGVDELRAALLTHMVPMLDVVRETAHITTRLFWGGVATSVAGASIRAVRMVDEARRPEVAEAAHDLCANEHWPEPRPLVSLDDDVTQQRRHTCCLIFLSPTHEECHTCPRRDRPRRSS